jgi:hypothetical protein
VGAGRPRVGVIAGVIAAIAIVVAALLLLG